MKTNELIAEMLGCRFCRIDDGSLKLQGKSSANAKVNYAVEINPCPVHLGKMQDHIGSVP